MFFIQVLQVDFLADFQFTPVYTGLLFLPPDVCVRRYVSDTVRCCMFAAVCLFRNVCPPLCIRRFTVSGAVRRRA